MAQDARGSWPRWIALLGIAVVALGSYALAPAIGGPSGLTKQKAKRLFYTKTQSNGRFAAKGTSYSKSESDGRYPGATGSFRITEHAGGWEMTDDGSGTATLSRNAAVTSITTGGASNGIAAQIPLSLPQTVFGRALRVTGVEICFDTPNSSGVDYLELLGQRATTTDPAAASDILAIYDPVSDDTGSTCRTLNPASPVAVNANDQLVVFAAIDITGAGNIDLSRVSLLLQP
jgi:hypothetical protein